MRGFADEEAGDFAIRVVREVHAERSEGGAHRRADAIAHPGRGRFTGHDRVRAVHQRDGEIVAHGADNRRAGNFQREIVAAERIANGGAQSSRAGNGGIAPIDLLAPERGCDLAIGDGLGPGLAGGADAVGIEDGVAVARQMFGQEFLAGLVDMMGNERAVGIGDEDLEAGESRVAGVELAIVVGVEDVGERLHVVRRCGVPESELDLVRLPDTGPACGVVDEHAISGAGPGGLLLRPIVRHVEEHVRRRQRRDLDPVAGQIEDDGVAGISADIQCHSEIGD